MSSTSEPKDFRALLKRALLKLDDLQSKLDRLNEPIAVIGLGCRFPKGANDPDSFWRLLCDGVDAISEIPPDRWDADAYYDPDPDAPGKMYTRSAGFLDRVDEFDPQFFGIAPREAPSMDPQQRLLLEVSWEALENAGQAPARLVGSRTGVYVGIGANDYSQLQTRFGDSTVIDTYFGAGVAHSIASGRISYVLGLQGPSISVDTACSSSLTAVHLACHDLRLRECDLALAGGVNVILSPDGIITASKARMLSPDGRCKTFDASADGYGRAEGCAMVVLKRLSDALVNRDNILALLRGTAANQDGRSGGLTAPSGAAQETVIREALAKSGIKPGDVSYFETHGTGTKLGDPIEVQSLAAVIGDGRSKERPALIGAVKSNIGHLEAAAGIAGLIKVILAVHHGQIPPSLHVNSLNPYIPWERLPVKVVTELTPWPVEQGKRIAGVSSFGFSGTNVHIVVEEAPSQEEDSRREEVDGAGALGSGALSGAGLAVERPLHLLCLSGKSKAALGDLVTRYGSQLASQPSQSLTNICFTANSGRSHLRHRMAVLADSLDTAREKLTSLARAQVPAAVQTGEVVDGRSPDLVFLFTGQGSQYPGMGRRLYETQPRFRRVLDRCDELLRPTLRIPLLSVLFSERGEPRALDETGYTQPALFALEYALAQLWHSWGIMPAAAMGHSVGEYVAACVAGVFSLEDGLRLTAERARLMQRLPGGGVMAAVLADAETVAHAIAPYPESVALAAINGPRSTVISGDRPDVEAALKSLEADGVKFKFLNVSHAFHSPLVEPMLREFGDFATSIHYSEPKLDLVSNVTGRLAEKGEVSNADYWCRHIRNPVMFMHSMRSLHEQGYRVFLELGPHPTLLGMAGQCILEPDVVWLPSLRRGQDDWQQMLTSLGTLYVQGVEVDWQGFDKDYPRRRIPLPTYPFQREHYWFKAPVRRRQELQTGRSIHPLLGYRLRSPKLTDIIMESRLDPDALPFLRDHRIFETVIVPATVYLEMAAAAAAEIWGRGHHRIEDFDIREALVVEDGRPPSVQTVITESGADEAAFEIYSIYETDPSTRNEWKLHARGRLRKTTRAMEDVIELRLDDLRGWESRCTEEFDREIYYRRLAESGVMYGPAFQAIRTIRRRDGEVVGRVSIPDQLKEDAGEYLVHPVILDACLQLVGAAIPGAGGPDARDDVYMPMGLKSYRVYRAPSDTVVCYVFLHGSGNDSATETITADIKLLDPDASLLAEVEGLRFKRADRGAFFTFAHRNLADWLYEPEWQDQELKSVDPPRFDSPGHWLMFADRNGVAAKITRILEENGQSCTLVSPGEVYGAVERHRLTIDPSNSEHYRWLLRELCGTDRPPIRGIIHLWSIDHEDEVELTVGDIEAVQTTGCRSILYLVQAVADEEFADGARIWVVTRRAQPAGREAPFVNLADATTWGMGRTISAEFPKIRCVRIDLDVSRDAEVESEILFREISSGDGSEDQIAFRGGKRCVLRLLSGTATGVGSPASHPDAPAFRLRPDATYLITGGMGGLGFAVAHWMVNRGARYLVLMGRRAPSDEVREGIREMELKGAKVTVAQADVSRDADVGQVLDRLLEPSAPLRGVIHAAGVIDDALLSNQDWERFENVMAPKVAGSWNLHLFTRRLDLDFFVMFSAGAALLGSPGQANYAAANSFMDALAYHRRGQGLPALSINWGPWSEVGMAAALGDLAARKWEARGIGVITPDQGLELLERLLRHELVQLAVLPLDWSRIVNQSQNVHVPPVLSDLYKKAMRRVIRDQTAPSRGGMLRQIEKVPENQRWDVLVTHVREQIVSVLGLKPSHPLPLQQGLTDLGMDSLMAVQLSNRLGASLDRSLPSTLAFEYPTLETLCRFLATEVNVVDSTRTSDGKEKQRLEQRAVLEAELFEMSQEQLEASLLDELDKTGY